MKKQLEAYRIWDVNISALKNPLLWGQIMMTALISSSYLLMLLIGINLFEGHWEEIPYSLTVGAVMVFLLYSAFSVILLLMYHRGIPTRYMLTDYIIEQYTLSTRRKSGRLLWLFGFLKGGASGYTAAGATALAKSREAISVRWQDIYEIKTFPQRTEIQLRNEWRTVMQVICPPDQYDDILRFIEDKISPKKSTKQRETPLAYKIILTIFTFIFGVFLFPTLPLRIVGVFSLSIMTLALSVLWMKGRKKKAAASILILLIVIAMVLAVYYGELYMTRPGVYWALIVETILLSYFFFIGFAALFKRIT